MAVHASDWGESAMQLISLINLTSHGVSILSGKRVVASWTPSGAVARLTEVRETAADLDTDQGPVPVTRVRYGRTVENLPPPRDGIAYVVSRVLAAAHPRPDLYFPADEVRDGEGRIVGCTALGQFSTGTTDA